MIEIGVMVMKNGKAWGEVYSDGHSTIMGWLNPEDKRAEVYDPNFYKSPLGMTYKGSPHRKELSTAVMVHVERHTTVVLK